MKDKKGFTLIELLAVIVILGIILTISIPQVSKYINSTREKTMRTNAQVFIDAVRDYSTSNNSFPYKGRDRKYYLVDIFDTIGLDKVSKKSPYGSEWNTSESYVLQHLSENNVDSYSIYLIDNDHHCIELTPEKEVASAEVKICG